MKVQVFESAEIFDASSQITITLQGGTVVAGGNGSDGEIVLKDRTDRNRIRLDANDSSAWIGGNGEDGVIFLFSSSGDNKTKDQANIILSGRGAAIVAGGNGEDGDILLKNGAGQNRIRLHGNRCNAWIGGNGEDGDIFLFPNSGDNSTPDQATIRLNGGPAKIVAGGNGVDGDIYLFPNSGDNRDFSQATIHLDGQTGDIRLSGADCAEEFDVLNPDELDPGTVMVIGSKGKLQQSKEAYDRKVAGVLSGSGDLSPGIVLDKIHSKQKRLPVALAGKVYCKVDADQFPIKVGDLLTTSPTPGHAMKADNPSKAFGAVIGKALRPLKKGKGLIPILAALH